MKIRWLLLLCLFCSCQITTDKPTDKTLFVGISAEAGVKGRPEFQKCPICEKETLAKEQDDVHCLNCGFTNLEK